MPLADLAHFYEAMRATVDPRRRIVLASLNNQPLNTKDVDQLEDVLDALQCFPQDDRDRSLINLNDERMIALDLAYEIEELIKDIYFCKYGEAKIGEYLRALHPTLEEESNHLLKILSSTNFVTWIADRDGTINNYCGRYASSVQSAYNALFCTRFARQMKTPLIITSAPLKNNGIENLLTMPTDNIIVAGSKGREYYYNNHEGAFPIDPDQQQALDQLNDSLKEMIVRSEYSTFGLIGSGIQFKFGQTTIARQDVYNSIPNEDSAGFLQLITDLVNKIDPHKEHFIIHDTGYDIEIALTVNSVKGRKDFDKGNGLVFLAAELHLPKTNGPALVCGDTFSDIHLITATKMMAKDIHTVFVTTDDDLKKDVLNADPTALFVSTPDILVYALNEIAKKS